LKILFLTRYDYDAASSRYRSIQYIPYLNSLGFECEYSPFFGYGYIAQRFSAKESIFHKVVSGSWRRFLSAKNARKYDVVVVESEIFPYFPSVVEALLVPGSIRYAVDYDDAIFYQYKNHPKKIVRMFCGSKIDRVMQRANCVIAGSEYLREVASLNNERVFQLPTVIDLRKYPELPPQSSPDKPFTIGWIGSQSTTVYLRSIERTLDLFCRSHFAQVTVIGGEKEPINIGALNWVRWADDTEIAHLSDIDVGIMPLPDNPWTRGKCAFKLIQYMGCWKPVIASPVGENKRVVEHGENGFLADSSEEWIQHLDYLYKNRQYAKDMGIRGRKKVEKEFCLDVSVPRFAAILRSVVV
jgi:glycosyltransferase involved in cell wall biosynthesis